MADTFDFLVWATRHPDAANALAAAYPAALADLQAHSFKAESKGKATEIEVETKPVAPCPIEAKGKEILKRLAVHELEVEAIRERRKKRNLAIAEARRGRFDRQV
jgi:hypothetical protein